MRKLLATMAARCDAALLVLVVGFSFSLAANLLWTWPGGIVRILGGALASFALPGAIHLWDKVPLPLPQELRIWRWTVRVNVMRLVRGGAMTGIAGMAAYTTFTHASNLLIQHGEEHTLATLYPVMTELLVVMGVLARKTPQKVAPKTRARQDAPTAPVVPVPKPVKVEINEELPPLEWARLNFPASAKEIQVATGVSKGYSYRLRDQVKAEMSP